MVGICLECDEHIDLDDEVDVDDIVVCPKCGTRFEILDLDPVTLDYIEKESKGS